MAETSEQVLGGSGSSPLAVRQQAMNWLVVGAIALVFFVVGVLLLAYTGWTVGPGSLIVAMIVASLPLPIYVGLALWLDRFEAEPPLLLAMAFFWGATIACLIALIFNSLTQFLVFKITNNPVGSNVFGMSFAAPLFEELAKGTVLFILFFWKKDEFDGITDGIVYAAMVGLGFAVTENVLYYGRAFAAGGAGATATLFFVRGILSPFIHPLFTSMTGIGLGIAVLQPKGSPLRIAAPLAGLGTAMFLHFLWNFSASVNAIVLLVLYLLIFIPLLLGVGVVVWLSLKREKKIIAENLQQSVQSGLLSADDVACVCSVRKRLGASIAAMKTGGFAGWKARVMFHQMTSELAFCRHRAARGIEGRVPSAEQEAYYTAMVQTWRAKL